MRTLAFVLAAVLALAGVAAPATASVAQASTAALTSAAPAPAPAAPLGPKVAIIVGPVHDGTLRYQGYGDQVYNEAIKWTNNVVRVYSPNATWSKVVAAVTGASIVVNIGHGNGWPAPYPWDPNFTGRDGFGLNYDVNGDGKLSNYELRYYGEPYIRTLKMAPNAIVLLFHMCYASGNQEPGGPEPTLSVARQRADNFASAFLAAGARAVLAIGHSNDPYYIRTLFTAKESLTDYFLHAPDFHNHVLSFPSVRTPGALQLLDPDSAAPSGFYRAFTGSTEGRTEDVTGAPYAATNLDPAALEVPGNANPIADGSPLYGTPDDAVNGVNPTTTLLHTKLLRVVGKEPVTSVADGSPIYAVTDNSAVDGYMPGSSLVPRDSMAPRIWEVIDGSGSFSPNGDGTADTFPLSLKLSESSAWSLQITNGWGPPITTTSGSGDTASTTWAPSPGSVSDGDYEWRLTATDALGNGPASFTGTITVDRVAPTLTLAGDPLAVPQLSPNGDKVRDTVTFGVTSSEGGRARAVVRNASDAVVATLETVFFGTGGSIIWDGRADGGTVVPDGTYSVSLTAADVAGNTSTPQTRSVQVYHALGFMTATPAIFFPQDGDTLARTTTVGFTLADPATVTWSITDTAGAVVRTIKSAEALAAGVYTYAWDGRNDLAAFVPRGLYRSLVTAGDGTLLFAQTAVVLADAFKIVSSDTTPAHGQRITVTVTTAEKLSTYPRLYVLQPGRATWSVGFTKLSSTTYRATFTVKSGAAGTIKFKVQAKDSKGKMQNSVLALPLH
jgi:flagellar hook assembly protein FlgD